ncbi:MAG: S1 RNA-binding domain-containing protein, partial [Bacteroidales bacterium]|nr:S1 RNA-binding domain-containing protein [Bacteroidales bacterium]
MAKELENNIAEEVALEPQAEVAAEPAQEEVIAAPKQHKSNASADNATFDWEAFENDGFAEADKKATEESYSQTLSRVAENEVVEGTVVALNKREVIVNIGYKSEGVVSINEFRYNPELAVGDKVDVFVENAEDKRGQLILSHKRARSLKSWDRVNEAYEKDEIVKGYIKCRTKGGMIVDVFGIEAFLPGSQIDVKPIRDYDIFVDKTMEFKIVKINHEFHNVVVSHKALIEAELEAQKTEIISKLEKGQILEGTVKN